MALRGREGGRGDEYCSKWGVRVRVRVGGGDR